MQDSNSSLKCFLDCNCQWRSTYSYRSLPFLSQIYLFHWMLPSPKQEKQRRYFWSHPNILWVDSGQVIHTDRSNWSNEEFDKGEKQSEHAVFRCHWVARCLKSPFFVSHRSCSSMTKLNGKTFVFVCYVCVHRSEMNWWSGHIHRMLFSLLIVGRRVRWF